MRRSSPPLQDAPRSSPEAGIPPSLCASLSPSRVPLRVPSVPPRAQGGFKAGPRSCSWLIQAPQLGWKVWSHRIPLPTWQLPGFWEPHPANPTLPRAEGAASSSLKGLRGTAGLAPSFPSGKEQTRNAAPSAPGNDRQGLKAGVGLGGSPPHPTRGSIRLHIPSCSGNARSIPVGHLPEPSQPPSTLQLRVFPPFSPFSSSLFPWLS